ncbi:MAG: insulinase family protein [Treponema sp.]|nr:insulinase family protein [Treponema sp.]
MKKICFLFCFNFLLLINCFCSPLKSISEQVLENGLTVFVLPDNSNALVRIEFCVKAGFSSQTQQTNGFFKLYSNLIEASAENFSFSSVVCGADSTRFVLELPPSMLYDVMDDLSHLILSGQFSNELINQEFLKLKKENAKLFSAPESILNAGIDSKVFSESPWKHDSGIYPELFKKYSTSQVRATLNYIGNNWYTPQNSAIFISGNILQKETLQIINQTFGRYYSNTKNPVEKKSTISNNQRKYVIHHPDFSSDITQIVVQYATLDMTQNNLASTLFNNDDSSVKYQIVALEELNIPGNEYINFSAANKKGTSRLIIQSLFQKPESKNIKTNSLQQSKLFLESLQSAIAKTSQMEFLFAKQQLDFIQKDLISNSNTFMENLCTFWAIQDYNNAYEIEDSEISSFTAKQMLAQFEKCKNVDFEEFSNALKYEEPFVFVITNSKDFKNLKSEYKKQGFEEINSQNGSWYAQEYYKNIKINSAALAVSTLEDSIIKTEEELNEAQQKLTTTFLENNTNSIQTFSLNNKIEVVLKENKNNTKATISLLIDGGKIHSKNNNGFEEVMISLLCTNIKKEIIRQQQMGIILEPPIVDWSSDLFTSNIFIECDKTDFEACCKAISNAIIFAELTPALADRAVSSRQFKKRLENGTALTQLYDKAIQTLYKDKELHSIFDSEDEVLTDINFTKIMNAYPLYLDAAKFDIIICGNYDKDSDSIKQILENTIGNLNNNQIHNQKEIRNIEQIDFPTKKVVKKKIVHTFLTDIPAEEAGPMPAVLIPTTEFLDPVLYILEAPILNETNPIFNALVLHFQEIFQNELSKNQKTVDCKVQVQLPQPKMPFASIVIQNVRRPKDVDAIYKRAYNLLKASLENQKTQAESVQLLNKIKNKWIVNELNQTSTNSGTSKLIQKGFNFIEDSAENQQNNTKDKATFYLLEFNIIENSTLQDYFKVLPSLQTPNLTVTSE